MKWHFERIPIEKRPELLTAWEKQDLQAVAAIINAYKVSPRSVCCNLLILFEWIPNEIQNGILKNLKSS